MPRCKNFLFQSILCLVLILHNLFTMMFKALLLLLLYLAINSTSFLLMTSLDSPGYFFLNISLKCLLFSYILKLLVRIKLGLKSKHLELMLGVSILVIIVSIFVWIMAINISCHVVTHLSKMVLLRENIST